MCVFFMSYNHDTYSLLHYFSFKLIFMYDTYPACIPAFDPLSLRSITWIVSYMNSIHLSRTWSIHKGRRCWFWWCVQHSRASKAPGGELPNQSLCPSHRDAMVVSLSVYSTIGCRATSPSSRLNTEHTSVVCFHTLLERDKTGVFHGEIQEWQR